MVLASTIFLSALGAFESDQDFFFKALHDILQDYIIKDGMGCKKCSDVGVLLGVGVIKLLSYGFIGQTGLLHMCLSSIRWEFLWRLFGLLCWLVFGFFGFVVGPF